jgi:hypothetical protein
MRLAVFTVSPLTSSTNLWVPSTPAIKAPVLSLTGNPGDAPVFGDVESMPGSGLGVTNRGSRSRLQLPFDLVEQPPVSTFVNDLLRS